MALKKLIARLLRPQRTEFWGSVYRFKPALLNKIYGDGKRLVIDGPFAETREQLGGYYLVDAKDLDDAMAIAERIPGARWGTIEIRPVMELSGLPAE